MSKNLDITSNDVLDAINSVLAGDASYAILTHKDRTPTIVLHSLNSSPTLDADSFWSEFLQDSLITYAYVRLNPDNGDDEMTRFALLSWKGPNVGIVFRNKFVFFYQEMSFFMNGKYHATMEVEGPLDFEELRQKLLSNDQGLFVTTEGGKTKRLSTTEAIAAARTNSFRYDSVRGSTTSLPPLTSIQKEILSHKRDSLSNSTQKVNDSQRNSQDSSNSEEAKKAEAKKLEEARKNEETRKYEQQRQEEERQKQEKERQEKLERQRHEEERRRQAEEEDRQKQRQQEEEKRRREEEELQRQEEERQRQQEEERQRQEEEERQRQEEELRNTGEVEEQSDAQPINSGLYPEESYLFTVVALWNFAAENPDDLPMSKGDVINVLRDDGEWYYAELNGHFGFIPANHVERQ